MNELKKIEFNFIDVETTGLSPDAGDRIIEIAAIKVRDFKIVDKFESLIDPEREVSYGAFLVNGISDDMLNGAPTAESVLQNFLRFASSGYWVAHNAKFDLKFINNELSRFGIEPIEDSRVLDTIKFARAVVPGLKSYSLERLAHFLEIKDTQIHRAMADVEMTYRVFSVLSEIAHKREIELSPDFLDLFTSKQKQNKEMNKKIERIAEAIVKKVPLKMLYLGSRSGATIRNVTPKEIMGTGKAAKIIGFCHLRNEERTFLLDKVYYLEEASI